MKRNAKIIMATLCSAVLLVGAGAACGETSSKTSKPVTISSEPVESSATNSSQPVIVSSEPAESSVESSEESADEKTVAHIGESATSDTLKIIFQSAKSYSVINEKSFEQKPDSGKKYVILNFKAENVSSEDEHINMFYIKAYCDDMSITQSTLLYYPDGYKILSGDLAAGKKLQGAVAFEVPENWQKLEISYKPIGGTELKFEVTAKEVEIVN